MKHGAVIIGFLLFLSLGGSLHASSSEALQSQLIQARENLRISLATEEWIIAGLEKLKLSGTASPETIAAYETYLERVRAIVAENRQTVARLEALRARYGGPPQNREPDSGDDLGAMLDPRIPEEQLTDRVEVLDRELDASLAQFDLALLKELELIRTQSAEKMRDLAEEAAAAARRLKEKGIDLEGEESMDASSGGAGESTASGEGSGEGDGGESISASEGGGGQSGESSGEGEGGQSGEGSGDGEGGESGSQMAKGSQGGSQRSGGAEGATGSGPSQTSGQGNAGTEIAGHKGSGAGTDEGRKGRYENVKDDDIVARQLREAAEKETDPVLKEKLWKEYEAYKKNQR